MPIEEPQDEEPHSLGRPRPAPGSGVWGRLGIAELLRNEGSPYLLDPKFRRHYRRYIYQALLATGAMACILLFVDSLSTAAIAAGLGSSVVGIFINPSGTTARLRAMVGGHTMALLLGSGFSLILFTGSIETFIATHGQFLDLAMAFSVGLLILVMAVTDTEHPPAAGIVIGMSSREWTPEVFGAILGALMLLAVIKLVLRQQLRDLL
ncbi:MAG: HPP family protein [Chloroflexi bacterium]|nr:HPP family protein [Chloroflexota bacterium]